MKQMRIEHDFLGTVEIPAKALYGIHSVRAARNFPDDTRFHIEWYKSLGAVKKACMITYLKYSQVASAKHKNIEFPFPLIHEDIIQAIINTTEEIEKGDLFDHFIVPAIQGGAGTSINMNINEIIANRTLLALQKRPGEYQFIDPVEHVNIFQSTNDVIPTSLKITLIRLLKKLEESVNMLRLQIEVHERNSGHLLRIAYTQMQEAVPSSFGRLMSVYNDALSRDWWRISKCFERIKTVNLGGSAIGTGITVPRYFIREVTQVLQQLTGLPVCRAENLQDVTANLDSLVEIHGILKAHAVNLEKISSDLRILASDIHSGNEIRIPRQQMGSSIMPDKVNPVIPEFLISAAHKVYSNDLLITTLSAQGCLDLNAYTPVIGHALIESVKLLIASNNSLRTNLITGLQFDETTTMRNLHSSPVISTALLPYIGYNKASTLAGKMKAEDIDVFEANKKLNLLDENTLRHILEPSNLLKEGFSLDETIELSAKKKK